MNPLTKIISLTRQRWKSWLFASVLILAGYYAIATQIDWWLFQFYSGRQARSATEVNAKLASSGLEITQLGVVRYAADSWPILAASRRVANPKASLCIFSGVHGNEPAGVEATLRWMADLGKSKILYPHVDVLAVPLVNPAGWVHDLRHNGENKDIARTFVQGSSQESTLIKGLLGKVHCDLLVDLHEDRYHSAVYLLSYGADPAHATALGLARKVRDSGYALRSAAPDGVYHVAPDKYPEIERATLSLYAQQHGVAQTFIVETPSKLPMNERVKVHRLVLDELAKRLNGDGL